jgi:hypothetical protein
VNKRIQNLLDLGHLVHDAAPDEEIVGLWGHALEAYDDMCLANRAPARRLLSAYDAGRVAALAVVRAANLRVRARNHHEMTFTAAGFLAGEEVADLVQKFQKLRLQRIEMEYGWKEKASPDDVERAISKLRLLLAHAVRSIGEQRPALQGTIEPPA